MASQKRPHLPAAFRQRSNVRALAFIAYSLTWTVLPVWLASRAVLLQVDVGVRAAAVVLLALLSSHGMHLLAFVGHDGIHLNLHTNKYVSAVLAILASSLVGSYMVVGYGVTHWNHHRMTNGDEDPDAIAYSRCQTFWSRLLLSRIYSSRPYMRDTLRLAFGLPLHKPLYLPFTEKELRWLARLNLLASLAWLCVYVAITVYSPWLGLGSILLPHVFTYCATGMRAYVEHAGLGVGPFQDTRSYTSALYTVLFFGNNYHLEHHLYPMVPCYHLPAIHRYLRQQGAYEGSGAALEPTITGVFRYMTARFPHPGPGVPRPSPPTPQSVQPPLEESST